MLLFTLQRELKCINLVALQWRFTSLQQQHNQLVEVNQLLFLQSLD